MNKEAANEVDVAKRKMRAKDAGAEEPAKHEFKGDVGYGVCDECGREKNDYEYHSEPAKATISKPVPCYICGSPVFIRPDGTVVSHYDKSGMRCGANETVAPCEPSLPVGAGEDVKLPKEIQKLLDAANYPSDWAEAFQQSSSFYVRELLAARKEIAGLNEKLEAAWGGAKIAFNSAGSCSEEWQQRAEKAEAALAQRDEEIAKLKGELFTQQDINEAYANGKKSVEAAGAPSFTFVNVEGSRATVLVEDAERMFHGLLVENARLKTRLAILESEKGSSPLVGVDQDLC